MKERFYVFLIYWRHTDELNALFILHVNHSTQNIKSLCIQLYLYSSDSLLGTFVVFGF